MALFLFHEPAGALHSPHANHSIPARRMAAAPRPLFPHDPGNPYIVLEKTHNHNQVSDEMAAAPRPLFPHHPGNRYIVLEKTHNHNQVSDDGELVIEPAASVPKLGLWGWYQDALLKRPLCTQMVTSAVLWSLGDLMAQSLSMAQSPASSLNWRRVAASGSFGGLFVGPTGHFWYQFLEYVCTVKLKLEPNSGRFVGTKLCADTFLFGPLHLLIFFFYMSMAAGKSLLQFQQDLQRDYFPTLLSEGVLWTCVQVVNFRYVPVKHQLLFVNCVCFVDSAFLSWIKHSDNVPWKHWTSKSKTK